MEAIFSSVLESLDVSTIRYFQDDELTAEQIQGKPFLFCDIKATMGGPHKCLETLMVTMSYYMNGSS